MALGDHACYSALAYSAAVKYSLVIQKIVSSILSADGNYGMHRYICLEVVLFSFSFYVNSFLKQLFQRNG